MGASKIRGSSLGASARQEPAEFSLASRHTAARAFSWSEVVVWYFGKARTFGLILNSSEKWLGSSVPCMTGLGWMAHTFLPNGRFIYRLHVENDATPDVWVAGCSLHVNLRSGRQAVSSGSRDTATTYPSFSTLSRLSRILSNCQMYLGSMASRSIDHHASSSLLLPPAAILTTSANHRRILLGTTSQRFKSWNNENGDVLRPIP